MTKKLLALATVLALLCSSTLSAYAATWDLNDGDVTVSVDADGTQKVSQSGGAAVADTDTVITGGNGSQSITVSTTGDTAADLTIENVKARTIEVGASNATITVSGSNTVNNTDDAGIHVSSGDLTITGDGTLNVNAQGKFNQSAGIGSNRSENMSGNITIKDNVTVNAVAGTSNPYASSGGASIGSGMEGEMSGSITIGDTADVTATTHGGMDLGAGIGSGIYGEMSGSITISTKATVDASSTGEVNSGEAIGAGANGANTGTIRYFDPDPEPTAPSSVACYRVVDENGLSVSCTSQQKDGVLTITAQRGEASFIITQVQLKNLSDRGVKTIVFITDGAASALPVSDLLALAKLGDSFCLTHKGAEATLTLNGETLTDVRKPWPLSQP